MYLFSFPLLRPQLMNNKLISHLKCCVRNDNNRSTLTTTIRIEEIGCDVWIGQTCAAVVVVVVVVIARVLL